MPRIEGAPNPKSVLATFAIPVCKNADQKEEIHTEVTKIAKEWMPRIEGAPNPKSVLATFAIPVCKNAIRRVIHTEVAKIAKEWTPRIEFKNRTLLPLLDGNQKPVETTAA
jgi:hypothetical protein